MKPSRPVPGDTVAVIAPASAPHHFRALERGIARLRQEGYRVEMHRKSFEPHGYLCGTDSERTSELNHFLQKPEIRAIFSMRGGYGSLRLLRHIDYAAAQRFPKLLVGYSDITAIQLALFRRTGLTSVSGPMVAIEWADMHPATYEGFRQVLQKAPYILKNVDGSKLRTLKPGRAEGTLLGGNLSLIVKLLGTPYLPPLKDAILFFEEVGEEPYRIDALFAQLKLAGVLDELGGLIIGGITEALPKPGRPSLTIEQIIEDYTSDLPCPVVVDLVYGHFPLKNSLPLGVRASIDASRENAVLTVLEPVVS